MQKLIAWFATVALSACAGATAALVLQPDNEAEHIASFEAFCAAKAPLGYASYPVTKWGESKLVFCADPDGNVIELADASIHDLIQATIRAFPDANTTS